MKVCSYILLFDLILVFLYLKKNIITSCNFHIYHKNVLNLLHHTIKLRRYQIVNSLCLSSNTIQKLPQVKVAIFPILKASNIATPRLRPVVICLLLCRQTSLQCLKALHYIRPSLSSSSSKIVKGWIKSETNLHIDDLKPLKTILRVIFIDIYINNCLLTLCCYLYCVFRENSILFKNVSTTFFRQIWQEYRLSCLMSIDYIINDYKITQIHKSNC